MDRYNWFFLRLITVVTFALLHTEDANGSIISPMFQTGPGVIIYLPHTSGGSTDYHVLIVDSFNYVKNSLRHEGIEMISYFVSNQTGKYTFFGTCGRSFSFSLNVDHQRFSSPQSTRPRLVVYLLKGFRYKLHTSFSLTDYCRVGVVFPVGAVSDPISSEHLFRSIEFYDKECISEHPYDSINTSSVDAVKDFYNRDPVTLGIKPISYACRYLPAATNDSRVYIFQGYLLPASSEYHYSYSFTLSCKHFCRFNLTERRTSDQMLFLENSGSTQNISLPPRHFFLQFWLIGSGSLRIYQHYKDGRRELSSVERKLLPTAETRSSIAAPSFSSVSSSAMRVSLNSGSRLAPKDNWTRSNRYEILCYDEKTKTLLKQYNSSSKLPVTFTLSDLANYTYYKCFARHYGMMRHYFPKEDLSATIMFNVISAFHKQRTAENVPSAEPKNLRGHSPMQSRIIIEWNAIPKEHQQGVLKYVVYRRMKGVASWKTSTKSVLSFTLSGLLENALYEFKVCGKTGAGEGPCSKLIAIRPAQMTHQITAMPIVSFVTRFFLTNKALVGHVTARHTVRTAEECFRKCSVCINSGACTCWSFNLEHIKSGLSGVCEINSVSAVHTPQDLVEKSGYQHYQVYTV